MGRKRAMEPPPEPPVEPEAGEKAPRKAVVIVGQSLLGLFSVLQAVDVMPDGVDLFLAGIPTEDSRRLAVAVVDELGSGPVHVFDHPVTPGVENQLRAFVGPRTIQLAVSASEDPAEQRVARELARRVDAPVWGATCAGGGWLGPDIPGFFGPATQRPAVAMRLARAVAAVVVDATKES